MAHNLCGKREIIVCQHRTLIGLRQHFCQWLQPRHHLVCGDAKVDQAGNFIHANPLELFRAGQTVGNGAKHAAVVEIALKSELKDCLHFLVRQPVQINLKRVRGTCRFLERRKRPSILFD